MSGNEDGNQRLRHPACLYLLGVVGTFQNIAFWGVGGFLVLFLVGELSTSPGIASRNYGLFFGTASVLPLIGGWLADITNRHRLFCIIGCVLTSMGAAFISLASSMWVITGLVFMATGHGLFSPTILTLLDKTYIERPILRDAGFSLFYAISSVGIVLIHVGGEPYKDSAGWSPFFLALAIAPLVGVVALVVSGSAGKAPITRTVSQSTSSPIRRRLSRKDWNCIAAITVVGSLCIVFWAGCTQMGSAMSLLVSDRVQRKMGGFTIPVSWFIASFFITIVILGPPLAKLWTFLAARKKDPHPLYKLAIGLALMSASFASIAWATIAKGDGAASAAQDVSPIILFIAFILQGSAAVIIAPVGFSWVTRVAPRQALGLVVGFWLTTNGLGGYLGAWVNMALLEKLPPNIFYSLLMIGEFLAGFILVLLTPRLRKLTNPSIE